MVAHSHTAPVAQPAFCMILYAQLQYLALELTKNAGLRSSYCLEKIIWLQKYQEQSTLGIKPPTSM